MPTQSIFAEKTVSISELRKKPIDYFIDEPVAVLSNNKTAGYMMSAELYEQMVRLLETTCKTSQFRPSKARLNQIASNAANKLLSAGDDELGGIS
jgi:antitoxin YafN